MVPPERRHIPRYPCTVESIEVALRELDVSEGRTLLVHSSLRSLGWVCGGATAVVTALLNAVGSSGTLVAPAFTSDNRDPSHWTNPRPPEAWWPAIRASLPPFDPALSPTDGMGAIAERIRTWPHAARSNHPHTSFAAVGNAAELVTADHDPRCHLGESSPLAALERLDALVLLLGVDFERCTAFHLAEYRQQDPPTRTYSCVVMSADGEEPPRRRWRYFDDVSLDDQDFTRLGRDFERDTNAVQLGKIGAATVKAFPVRAAVKYAQHWLPGHRPSNRPGRVGRPGAHPTQLADASRSRVAHLGSHVKVTLR